MSIDDAAPRPDSTPEPPRPWSRRSTLAAVGIAAAIAGLGGAAVYATTGNAAPQFGGPPAAHGPGQGEGPSPGALGVAAQGRGPTHGPPVHGQVVVADGSGGFLTTASQAGTVIATTPDSLTVRSADGFTQTWATSAGQGSKFGVDDSVVIQGQQRGGAAQPTVVEVLDANQGTR